MLRLPVLVLVFAYVTLPAASAQTTDSGYPDELSPSLAASAKAMHAMIHRDIAEAAENMPTDEYGFRPTPQVRPSVRLSVTWLMRTSSSVRKPRAKSRQRPLTTNNSLDKAVLVKALNDSLVYCDRVYGATTEAKFIQPDANCTCWVGTGSTNTLRGAVLMYNIAHNNEHYGNLAIYMRLKGHVPPSTARVQQRTN